MKYPNMLTHQVQSTVNTFYLRMRPHLWIQNPSYKGKFGNNVNLKFQADPQTYIILHVINILLLGCMAVSPREENMNTWALQQGTVTTIYQTKIQRIGKEHVDKILDQTTFK